MDDLRTALLKKHYPIERMFADGIAPVVNKTSAHYKRPLTFGDSPRAVIRITVFAKVRWEVQAEISGTAGKTFFTAVQSGAFVNLESGKPVPIPSVLKEKWDRYHADSSLL
jgi:acyl-CoA thioesterase FadM